MREKFSTIKCWETRSNGMWKKRNERSPSIQYCEVKNFCYNLNTTSIDVFVSPHDDTAQYYAKKSITVDLYARQIPINVYIVEKARWDISSSFVELFGDEGNFMTKKFIRYESRPSHLTSSIFPHNLYHSMYEHYFSVFMTLEESGYDLKSTKSYWHQTPFTGNYEFENILLLDKAFNPPTIIDTMTNTPNSAICFRKALVGSSFTHSYNSFLSLSDYGVNSEAKKWHLRFSDHILGSYGIRRSIPRVPRILYAERHRSRTVINGKQFNALLKRIAEFGWIKIKRTTFKGVSLENQMRIASKSSIIMGVTGAGLTHSIFMGKGTVVMPFYGYLGKKPYPRHWEQFAMLYNQVYYPYFSPDKKIHVDPNGLWRKDSLYDHHVRVDLFSFIELLIDALQAGIHKKMDQRKMKKLLGALVNLKKDLKKNTKSLRLN